MKKILALAAITLNSVGAVFAQQGDTPEGAYRLARNVLPISAKGHTPGHTAYQLGNLLFVGDLMHGISLQLPDPTICARYDANRPQSIATRTLILRYATAHSLIVLGAHVPGNGVVL